MCDDESPNKPLSTTTPSPEQEAVQAHLGQTEYAIDEQGQRSGKSCNAPSLSQPIPGWIVVEEQSGRGPLRPLHSVYDFPKAGDLDLRTEDCHKNDEPKDEAESSG